jgi:hypothetical protein
MSRGFLFYNQLWDTEEPSEIEAGAISHGGRWQRKDGEWCGEGLFYHHKALWKLLWPEFKWNRWAELLLKEFCENRIIGVLGPASSSKTTCAALFGLATYYSNPEECSVLCSSTTRESLENRIWGEIKKWNKRSKDRYEWIPGEFIESRQRIITSAEEESLEGRDFRNGLQGVPCKKGEHYVGLSEYSGIKNKIIILIGDELQFMPGNFVDAVSNLNKNAGFKMIGLGNPKDKTDALGKLTEPSDEDGGWDGVDQSGKTKTWNLRFAQGKAVQLVGTDSPNFDVAEGVKPPFPFLITREQIATDLKFYGRDSLQFSMMNLGMMPKDSQSRRVITRSLCVKFMAMEEVVWADDRQTDILGLDAAYGSVGGDRCVAVHLKFGMDVNGILTLAFFGGPIIIPVSVKMEGLPQDQIALFLKDYATTNSIPPANLFYDSTGKGDLHSSFTRLWSGLVVPVEFGGKADERVIRKDKEKEMKAKDLYGKRVSQLWFTTRLVIESNQMRQMPNEVMEEGCMREWILMPSGKQDVEPKDITRTRMGRSPDLFDATVVAVEGALQRGFKIGKLGNYTKPKDGWLEKMKLQTQALHKSKQLSYG